MAVPTDGDRRQHSRESIELVVRYQRLNAFFADYAKNISRGGTFVATSEPLPPDTEFVFSLAVPELADPLQLRAKVMWTTPPEAATKVHPAGMGIQFQYKDAEERGQLEGLIERLIVDHLGQRHADRILGRVARPTP
jgi:type IV pilus assembly protein PilZ